MTPPEPVEVARDHLVTGQAVAPGELAEEAADVVGHLAGVEGGRQPLLRPSEPLALGSFDQRRRRHPVAPDPPLDLGEDALGVPVEVVVVGDMKEEHPVTHRLRRGWLLVAAHGGRTDGQEAHDQGEPAGDGIDLGERH